MHERTVGAVFQQPAHQVRQQILIRAHRGIHPDRSEVRHIPAHRIEQHLTHPMQALKLVLRARRSQLDDRGNRQRVVSRELRIQHGPRGEQALRAGQIIRIRRRLAGKHREFRKATLLRTLDLGIPIGAFDQTNAHLPAGLARQRRDPIDDKSRPPAICLYRQTQPRPAARRRVARQRLDQIERQVQTVRFLGVDRQAGIRFGSASGEFLELWRQPLENAVPLQQVVAGLERRELH